MVKPQILLTNDDGIRSPGLWAAAESLSSLGFVTVAAPRSQSSAMGRSLPSTSDGTIKEEVVEVGGKSWKVYAVGGSPAQAVLHGIFEIMPEKPDLVVSGINYGENVACGITISGTVGAALEAASFEIPSLAISLQTPDHLHFSYSKEIDFSIAAHFAKIFGEILLNKDMPLDVDLLKVDVPIHATEKTGWQLTRVSRQRYYEPIIPERESWDEKGIFRYRESMKAEPPGQNTDVHVLRNMEMVSVTPISLDLSSRVDLNNLDEYFRSK